MMYYARFYWLCLFVFYAIIHCYITLAISTTTSSDSILTAAEFNLHQCSRRCATSKHGASCWSPVFRYYTSDLLHNIINYSKFVQVLNNVDISTKNLGLLEELERVERAHVESFLQALQHENEEEFHLHPNYTLLVDKVTQLIRQINLKKTSSVTSERSNDAMQTQPFLAYTCPRSDCDSSVLRPVDLNSQMQFYKVSAYFLAGLILTLGCAFFGIILFYDRITIKLLKNH